MPHDLPPFSLILPGEAIDFNNITQPLGCHGHQVQVYASAVKFSESPSTDMSEDRDILPLFQKGKTQEIEHLRHSQRLNFGRPPVHFVQDEFEWYTNLPGTTSSSGVEYSRDPNY